MHHYETTPKVEKPSTNTVDKVIAAVPLSYKRPGDDVVISVPRKKRTTSETPEGWACEARPRKNGVVDKYYYHKELKIRCRSLQEIYRFQKHGILPGRGGKEKEQEIIAQEMKKSEADRCENLK